MALGTSRGESAVADANIGVFDSPDVVAGFAEGHALFVGDAGERQALRHVASAVRGRPVLDVGVGAGRTTWSLLLLTDDYVAIDAAPRMVDLCRRNHPGVDVRRADVRDLSAWGDGSFGLVTFSNNGLDALGHADRGRALRELARVTEPGGFVTYSTHLLDGPSYRERPWQLHPSGQPLQWSAEAAARQAVRVVRRRRTYVSSFQQYARLRRHAERHAEWAMAPLRAHEFRLLTHFVSIRGIETELTAAGLTLVGLWSLEGEPVDPAAAPPQTHYLHVVASKARDLSV